MSIEQRRCEQCKAEIPRSYHNTRRFCDDCIKLRHKSRCRNRYHINMGTVIRNVCIKKNHQLFIKKTHLNLSRFIQEKLSQEMKARLEDKPISQKIEATI